MLVVRVELWPSGNSEWSEELGRAALANVTGLGPVSDYLVVRLDRHGRHDNVVAGHVRSEGFWALVSRATAGGEARKPPDAPDDRFRMVAERLDPG